MSERLRAGSGENPGQRPWSFEATNVVIDPRRILESTKKMQAFQQSLGPVAAAVLDIATAQAEGWAYLRA